VPLALIAGQLASRRGFAPIMGALAAVQAMASLYLLHTLRFADQMEVVAGKVDSAAYQAKRIGFYTPAQSINQLGATSKVALYDEVFGYLLDVPYYWANPGHGTMIPYDQMSNGQDFADGMRAMGFTHVYLNLSPQVKDPALAAEILAGLNGGEFLEATRERLMASWEQKFNALVVAAVQEGRLAVKEAFGNPAMPRAVLLEFK
jgi:hypothetical protein